MSEEGQTMVVFSTSANVGEDHRVTLTLPPEVPPGKATLIVTIQPEGEAAPKPARTSLADWAAEHAENLGDKISSSDVEGFTGRTY